jgi:transcriptional regulator with PAS, ATPase and Fis domain/CHASE2 domain-containing sensor protein
MTLRRYIENHYFIAAGMALLSFLVVAVTLPVLDGLGDWENKTLDYRFRLRENLPVDPRIVMVDIDDQSIGKIGRWPWDRTYHARMIEILSESGAAVTGYDILFNAQTGRPDDTALITAIRDAGNVYLPIGFDLEKGPDLLNVKRAVGPFDALTKVAAGMGHISSNRDRDGMVRRVPLLVNKEGHPFPSFSLGILARYFQVPSNQIIIESGKEIVLLGPSHLDMRIPIDDAGMMPINYAGRWVETFTHFSFIDVLMAWDNGEKASLANLLRGKIVIVSNTATGYDIKPIPLEPAHPGGGIHANAINTILTRRFLKEEPLLMWAMTLGFSWLAALAIFKTRLWIGVGAGMILSATAILVSIGVFHGGIIVPTLPPFLAIVMTSAIGLLYQHRRATDQVEFLCMEKEALSKALAEKIQALEEIEKSARDTHPAREKERRARGEKQQLEKQWAACLPIHMPDDLSDKDLEGLMKACNDDHKMITRSPVVLKIFNAAMRIAPTDATVLIFGESGTGKEKMAAAIKNLSRRKEKGFISFNCGALAPGLLEDELFGHEPGAFPNAIKTKAGRFEQAHNGTMFLDEIGDIELQSQVKLLRVIQEGEFERLGGVNKIKVDVRLIAATHRDLSEMVRKGTFREDLFYRLNVIPIMLPPLRDRKEDIEPLCDFFVKQNASKGNNKKVNRISSAAMNRIKSYAWPGNIRELENAIERAVTLAGDKEELTDADFSFIPVGRVDAPMRQTLTLPVPNAPTVEFLSDTENEFLAVLMKNKLDMKKTAEDKGIRHHNAITGRLKGLCFKTLAYIIKDQNRYINDSDIAAAVDWICGEMANGDIKASMKEKISEYHNNHVQKVEKYAAMDLAVRALIYEEWNTNTPVEYKKNYEALIQQYFKHTKGEQ